MADVIEVLRPLATEPVAGAPPFVLGLAMLRGAPVPVVDLACLLTGRAGMPTRWLALRLGTRRLAMAVEQVVGVRNVDSASFAEMPALLRGAGAEIVTSVGKLDRDLLIMLNGARALPEELWATLTADGAA